MTVGSLSGRMPGISLAAPTGTASQTAHGRLLPGLDGLRAVAALLVVTWHAGQDHLHWMGGSAGVPIFFVLSGYLITRLALGDEESRGFSFRAFWIRRATRIFPLYFTAVLLFAIFPIVGSGGMHELRSAWPYYLTFNGEYAPPASMVIAWSLGIEEKFYLVWPVIGFLLLRRSRFRLQLALAAAVLAFALDVTTDWRHPGSYGSILVGCALALAERSPRWSSRTKLLRRPAAGWLLAGGVMVVLALTDGPLANNVDVAMAPIVAALIVHVAHGSSRVVQGLSGPVMRYLGRRSFGIYLFHTFALGMTARVIHPGSAVHDVIIGLACLVGGLMMAELGYRFIEWPMIQRGRSWANAPQRA